MSADEASPFVELGVITRPHGVRGEVRIHPWNPDSTLLAAIDELVLLDDVAPRPYRVLASRRAPKAFLIKLEGVDSYEAADALRGQKVAVPRETLPDLDEDEFYLVDLVGLEVRRDGARVGEVVEVFEYPSIECIAVRFDDGLREIPLNRPWVEEVDVDAGAIHLGAYDDVPLTTPTRRDPGKSE